MLQVQHLCSCGLLIACGNDAVLLDAPNTAHRTFQVMNCLFREKFEKNEEPFNRLNGLIFSHTHPDHCNLPEVKEYLRLHPNCKSFIPTYDTPDEGYIEFGSIGVQYKYIKHMDVPEGMKRHYVFLIEADGKTLYVTSDAVANPQEHETFLRGRHVDIAFWNPYYLMQNQMREWITGANVCRHYVYHIPIDERDETGIRRKVQSCMENYYNQLAMFQLLTDYPSMIYKEEH